ncbi:hypothetical protein ATKI12_0588 [Kitasatospora sp. Ki12]
MRLRGERCAGDRRWSECQVNHPSSRRPVALPGPLHPVRPFVSRLPQ